VPTILLLKALKITSMWVEITFFFKDFHPYYLLDDNFFSRQYADTALIKSIEGGHTTIAKLLLQAGADKDVKNKV